MALFVRLGRFFGWKPQLAPARAFDAGEEMFEFITNTEANQATREYFSQLLDAKNGQAAAEARERAKQNVIPGDWQIVSKDANQVRSLQVHETAEFCHFLDHQFDGDGEEASFVF